jgi:hypothetical protein
MVSVGRNRRRKTYHHVGWPDGPSSDPDDSAVKAHATNDNGIIVLQTFRFVKMARQKNEYLERLVAE